VARLLSRRSVERDTKFLSHNSCGLLKELRRVFFSEEKKQKTFIFLAAAGLAPGNTLAADEGAKVFWFFSSEKNTFLIASWSA
jgi:hypothetical protein